MVKQQRLYNNNLTISRENALAAYDNTDANGREMLEHLFGKELFVKKDITERIKTFEDACNALGDKHPFVMQFNCIKGNRKTVNTFEDVVAYLKLRIIVAALNEGWEPKFEKGELRYYPWFYLYTKEQYDELDDEEKGRCVLRSGYSTNSHYGFVSCGAYNDASHSFTYFGSRLAFRTRELAAYAGRQFIEEWADFMFQPRTGEELNGKSEAAKTTIQ